LQCATVSDAELTGVAWADADIARFLDRRARLMRWGWAELDAERQAERLVKRDREHDERVSCADCAHYRPGRCANHCAAGLRSAELGRDLVAMLQRCPGFHHRDGRLGSTLPQKIDGSSLEARRAGGSIPMQAPVLAPLRRVSERAATDARHRARDHR
jgi:hypothetical protein